MSGDLCLLGFDYGERRIGVAMGQQLGQVSRRLTTLKNGHSETLWQQINQLVEEWLPDALVVGLSRHADGSDSPVTQAIRRFAAELKRRFRLPVYFEDERLSSVAAKAVLQAEGLSKPRIEQQLDSESAHQILLSWLQQHDHD